MGIVGFTYQQERSFDVMQTAAGNEGSAGAIAGAGMGLGMGLAMGPSVGQAFGQMAAQVQPQQPPSTQVPAPTIQPSSPVAAASTAVSQSGPADPSERIRLLKELASLKAEGILTDEEFVAEKKKILAGN